MFGVIAGAVPAVSIAVGAAAAPATAQVAKVPGWVGGQSGMATASGDTVRVAVYLKIRDEAALTQLATAVSTPGNASYRHYISAATFRARFSPTQASVDSVANYLTAHGFKITSVPTNRLYVQATGNVSAANAAFATTLRNYSYKGQARRAPGSAPTLPASIASGVAAVDGLTLGDTLSAPDHASADAAAASKPGAPAVYVVGHPCSVYWGQLTANFQADGTTPLPTIYGGHPYYSPCGYAGTQVQAAYGMQSLIASGVDGRGQIVAITDAYASPTMLSDAQQYSSNHNLPAFNNPGGPAYTERSVPPTNQNVCGPDGWAGEESLDVDAVHTMAPNASILYEGAASCYDQDLIAAINDVVDNQKANIITNSWGGVGDINQLPADLQHAYTHTFLQAVSEGIGIYFSSGDNGDELARTGVRTVDFPASDPWVTAVGGTSLAEGANGRLYETGWSTSKNNLSKDGKSWNPAAYVYGAGGGTSQVFGQPTYQAGVVPNSISQYFGGSFKGRAVPDISAVGDPNTGFTYGETVTYPDGSLHYAESRIGGTSLSSPLIAGMMAVADQVFGAPHGFANPAIYQLTGTSAIHDIGANRPYGTVRTNYNNGFDPSAGYGYSVRNFGVKTTIWTRVGYDDVTGVGTPNGIDFLADLGTH